MDQSSLSRSRLYFWLFISFVILLSLVTGIYALKHPQIFKSKASEEGSVEIISSEGEKADNTVNTTQIQLQIITPDWSQPQSFKFNLVTQVYAQEEGEQSDEDSIPEPTPDQDVPAPEPTPEDLPETTELVKISLNPEAIQKDAACFDSFDAQSRCLEMPFSDLLARGGKVDWFLPEQEGEYTIYIGFISNKGNFKSTSKSTTLSRQVAQPDNPVEQVSEDQSTVTPQYSCDCIDFDNICNSACSEYGTVGNYCTESSSCTTKVEPGLPQFTYEGKDPQQLYRDSGVSLEDYQKILKDLIAVYGDKVIGWIWQDLSDGERRPNPVYSDTQSFPSGIPSISEDQAREIGIFTIGAATGVGKRLLAPGYALVHMLTYPDVAGETFLTVSQLKEMGINIEVTEQTDPQTGETEIVIGPDINQILAQANSLGLALQLFPDPDPQTQEVRFVVLPPINPTTLEQIPTLLVDTFLGEVGGRVIGKAIHITLGKVFKRSAPAAAGYRFSSVDDLLNQIRNGRITSLNQTERQLINQMIEDEGRQLTPDEASLLDQMGVHRASGQAAQNLRSLKERLDQGQALSLPSENLDQTRYVFNAHGELRTVGVLPEGSFYAIEEADVAVLKDTLRNKLGVDVDSLGIKISWYLDDMPSFAALDAGGIIANFPITLDRAIEVATQYAKAQGVSRTFASAQEAQAYLKSLAPEAFIHEVGHALYEKLPIGVIEGWKNHIATDIFAGLRSKVVEVQAGKVASENTAAIADEAFADFFVEMVTNKPSRIDSQPAASNLARKMVSDYTGSPLSKVDPRGEVGFVLPGSGEGLIPGASDELMQDILAGLKNLERLMTEEDIVVLKAPERQALLTGNRLELRARMRAKYGLPPDELRSQDTGEYIRRLEGIARENGIDVRKGYEFQGFFEKNPGAGAFYDPRINAIVVPYVDNIIAESRYIEHELVHALQYKYYPRMTLRMMEYEAYLTETSQATIASDPGMIGLKINMSVATDNRLAKEAVEELVLNITPPRIDPRGEVGFVLPAISQALSLDELIAIMRAQSATFVDSAGRTYSPSQLEAEVRYAYINADLSDVHLPEDVINRIRNLILQDQQTLADDINLDQPLNQMLKQLSPYEKSHLGFLTDSGQVVPDSVLSDALREFKANKRVLAEVQNSAFGRKLLAQAERDLMLHSEASIQIASAYDQIWARLQTEAVDSGALAPADAVRILPGARLGDIPLSQVPATRGLRNTVLQAQLQEAMELAEHDIASPVLTREWKGFARLTYEDLALEGVPAGVITRYGFQPVPNLSNRSEKGLAIAGLRTRVTLNEDLLTGKAQGNLAEFLDWLKSLHQKQYYYEHETAGQLTQSSSPGQRQKTLYDIDGEYIIGKARVYNDPVAEIKSFPGKRITVELTEIPSEIRPYTYYGEEPGDIGVAIRHAYGPYDALNQYLEVMQRKILQLQQMGNGGSDEDAFRLMAEFYQYAINTHMFVEVNHSLFANMVNHFLEVRGYKPIQQGALDFYGYFFQPDSFYQVFVGEVKKVNPGI